VSKKQKGPKLKTHKATASRIHVTGTGKLMRLKIGRSHLRRRKSSKVKRQYGAKLLVEGGFNKRIRKLLPHTTRLKHPGAGTPPSLPAPIE
jgi:large subunit ribosomal protein L35